MDSLKTILLALIQGMSEFLPISSSAHLILPSQVLGWPDQGLAFDVAVHIGSLIAVVFYFRKQLQHMLTACLLQLMQKPLSLEYRQDAELGWKVVLATVPAVLVGLWANGFIEAHLRSIEVIAATTIIFGVLLGWAELQSRRQVLAVELSYRLALIMGFAQTLALIPGTSRSGVTMTVAVLLGLSRTDSAKFSFLMSIPIILAAGLFSLFDLIQMEQAVAWSELALAVLVSGLSAWSCIALFLKLIEKIGFIPFVVYRLVLGAVLIAISAGMLSLT